MSALALATTALLCASLDRRMFAAALARLKHIIPRRGAFPALEAILIDAVGDTLSLTASDANSFVRVVIPSAISSTGALLLPLRRLSEVVKGSCARVQIAGEQLMVGAATHRVSGLNPSTFPVVPEPAGELLASWLRPTFARLLSLTTYAMSEDDSRLHLCALYFERKDGEFALVATDGHRLAIARAPDNGQPFSVLMPRKTIEQVERMVAQPGGLVHLRREGDRVWFVSGEEWVSGLVVDARFPSYEQVIPAHSEACVTMATSDLRDALGALAPRGTPGVKLTLDRDGGRVKLSVEDGDGNATEVEVLAAFTGEVPKAIGVNGRYLRELVEALGEEATVTLHVTGELDPMRVDGAHGMTAVVMPMRV